MFFFLKKNKNKNPTEKLNEKRKRNEMNVFISKLPSSITSLHSLTHPEKLCSRVAEN